MGAKLANGLFLVVITTSIFLSIGMSSSTITRCTHWKNSSGTGCVCGDIGPPGPPAAGRNDTRGPRRISVNWNSSFVFDVWAAKNSRIYANDTLEFKYRKTWGSNVYLMPDGFSYRTCNFDTGAKLIANASAGRGHAGFPFLLNPVLEGSSSSPFFYFASKPQCALGMKLYVNPVARRAVGKN